MIFRSTATCAFALCALLGAPRAQTYAIGLLYNGNHVLDGFNCANNLQVQMLVGDRVDLYLASDTFGPAGIAFAIGPAFPCPAIPVPGFGNELLLTPGQILPIGFSTTLSVARGGYIGWNYVLFRAPTYAQLVIPASALGLTLTVQGIVPRASGPTFTQAIEITIV